MQQILDLLVNQDTFFKRGSTKSIGFRKKTLQKLRRVIIDHEPQILEALHKDLGKPKFEAYTSEIGIVLKELDYFIKNIEQLTRPQRKPASIINFPSSEYIYHDPFGRVLIIAPWNYPFQLVLNPLIAAVAAGNTVVCKPSEISENTSKLLVKLISEVFSAEHVAIVEGGKELSTHLLKQKWDFIFFTGSSYVGKIVLKAAAEHLCPVVLELGGKSPVIVNRDAKLALAAKRIIWGKLFNAGQTCIAPDYIYVHKDVKKEFTECLIAEIKRALSEQPKASGDFARIINPVHFKRITKLIDKDILIYGGDYDETTRYIQPSLLNPKSWDDDIMQEEIFGPLLPIMSFTDLSETIALINSKEKALAAYYFGENKKEQEQFLNNLYFGGGCINDVLSHITSKSLPFGGVGTSGMGSYHGKKSFDCFSHAKGILKRGSWIDIPLRYAPYKSKLDLVKKIFKL